MNGRRRKQGGEGTGVGENGMGRGWRRVEERTMVRVRAEPGQEGRRGITGWGLGGGTEGRDCEGSG